MKTSATAYSITVDGEHGTFFVRSGINRFTNAWLELTINSTFGTFGYTFGSIGGAPAEFLAKVDYAYLMNKLMGKQSTVFDADKASREARKEIAEHRRSGDISKGEARDLFDEVATAESDCNGSEDRFFHMLAENDRMRDWEIWCIPSHSENPQALGFWEKLWPAFIAELRADSQAVPAASLAIPAAIVHLSECRVRGWEDSALAYRSGWNDCRRAALGDEPLGYAGCHELATATGVKS
jgi:hypothetical protein